MTDKLTIFGKAFRADTYDCAELYSVDYGLFHFVIEQKDDDKFAAYAAIAGTASDESPWFATKELARDWLESEARRIMLECLVMAGPVEAWAAFPTEEESVVENRGFTLRFEP